MSWRNIKLGEVITHRKEFIMIDNSIEYKRCRVQVHRKGVVLRDVIKGILINTKKQQVCKQGDFLVAEIDAKVGGYGFVPKGLNGAIVSSHYFLFDVDETKMLKSYLAWIIKTDIIQEQINSKGSTNYAAIRPSHVLNFEIPLPSIKEQRILVERINNIDAEYSQLKIELENQQTHLQQLRQAILQEAVQGKLSEPGFARLKDDKMKGSKKILSSSNPKNHSSDEDAAQLLQRIKAEKQKLIAAGKLKKEKELPPITEDEIPFELPKGWVWCRLGEIIEVRGGKRLPNGHQLTREDTGQIYVRVTDMQDGTIDDSDLHYVKPETFKQIKNYIINKEDLYLVIVGSTIGKSGTVPEMFDGMSLTENAVKLRPVLVDKILISYSLKSKTILEQFYDKTKQVGQPKLAIHRIQSSLFPLPPLSEQHRIVAKVQQLMQMANQLEQQVAQSQAQAQQLLQAVLKEAFTSKGKEYKMNEEVTMAAED